MRSSREPRVPTGLGFVLVVAACATSAAMACTTESTGAPLAGPDGGGAALCGEDELTYENFGGPFFLDWCTGCHSSRLDEGQRQGAPAGVDFDTLDGIVRHRDRIVVRAVELETMPPVGGPSDGERARLREWLECGAPVQIAAFTPPPPPALMTMPPDALGECAGPMATLPVEILPRCTAATYACVLECNATAESDDAKEACRDACTKADGTPGVMHDGMPVDCTNCSFMQMMGCGSQNGCEAEVGALRCCIQDCIATADPACFERECTGAIQGFGYCVYFNAPSCIDYQNGPITECFAAAP